MLRAFVAVGVGCAAAASVTIRRVLRDAPPTRACVHNTCGITLVIRLLCGFHVYVWSCVPPHQLLIIHSKILHARISNLRYIAWFTLIPPSQHITCVLTAVLYTCRYNLLVVYVCFVYATYEYMCILFYSIYRLREPVNFPGIFI